mmetsp:Transcript_55564/g.154802  ORF Transcript_55564/g.154802 Transcript_55564/m.154802 type:complete len:209 (-) Transcript_55564:450-1076(-)
MVRSGHLDDFVAGQVPRLVRIEAYEHVLQICDEVSPLFLLQRLHGILFGGVLIQSAGDDYGTDKVHDNDADDKDDGREVERQPWVFTDQGSVHGSNLVQASKLQQGQHRRRQCSEVFLHVLLELWVRFGPHVELVLGDDLNAERAEDVENEEEDDEGVRHDRRGGKQATDQHPELLDPRKEPSGLRQAQQAGRAQKHDRAHRLGLFLG